MYLDSIQNNNFQKSIMAGICVSLGCICYLSINDKLIGSLLFSIGLFSIFTYDLNLYTGKIGKVKSFIDVLNCIIYLIGNMVGCILMYLFIHLTPIIDKTQDNLNSIAKSKNELTLTELFFLGILCGILMLLATKDRTILALPVLCVSVFIMIGAEHSVANSFFLLAYNNAKLYLIDTIAVATGNAVGAIIANKMTE